LGGLVHLRHQHVLTTPLNWARWEPEERISAPDLVDEFWQKRGLSPGPSERGKDLNVDLLLISVKEYNVLVKDEDDFDINRKPKFTPGRRGRAVKKKLIP
jgi:hypothetical protein